MLLDTPVCDFGWKAPGFNLLDADGQPHSLQSHLTERGLLVAFISNHCPYVKGIAQRLVADTQQLMAEGIGVIAIMSNDYQRYEADAPQHMTAFSKQHGFPFVYAVDEDQSVAKAYDAVCTPDFFGFNGQGELQYRGRLDNWGISGFSNERDAELLKAMRQIAETGKGPAEQSASMGCSIKWR